MLHRATVSVVIPAYNHAAWIASAIQSVLAQTYTDWELIIIDDASTDATLEVLQGFQDPRIRLFQHATNQGAPATLNNALATAEGEYCAILNSDDIWHPARLEHCLQIAQSQGAQFVASAAQIQYSNETTQPKWQAEFLKWYDDLQQELATSRDFFATLARGNFLLTTSNFFFHKSVLERLGGFNQLRYLHDYDFALRVCEADIVTAFSPNILLAYRQHDHNTIHESPMSAAQENLMLLYAWLPRLQGKLSERGWANIRTQLQDLQTMLHGEWCAKLHNSLVAKEQELFSIIAERDQLVADQQQGLAQRDTAIAEQKTLLEQQATWITDRDQWIAERDAWISERDQAIWHLEFHIEKLERSSAYKLGKTLLKPTKFLKVRKSEHYA